MAKNTRDHLRVDWFRVLRDIRKCGYSVVAVSREVGVPRSTLRRWIDADNPAKAPLEDGLRVIEFWCTVTGKPQDQLPWLNQFAPYPSLNLAQLRHRPATKIAP
jgi:hypothetical protein